MIKKFICLFFIVFFPLYIVYVVGQNTDTDSRNEETIRQVYDSLELCQMPARNVAYSCRGLYEINVTNQQQFDQMSSMLQKALKDGKRNIKVKIKKGTYFFKDGYMTLKGLNYPDADIRIEGKDAVIVPVGYDLKHGDAIPCDVSGETCYLDLRSNTSISTWGDMMYTDELIEVVDLATKTCRLKCDAISNITLPEGNQAYLDLTRWCRCYQYKVLKIESGYVYFYAHDLEKDHVFHKDEYNVNYDYIYAKAKPRFRLCNVGRGDQVNVVAGRISFGDGFRAVHLSNASTFMALYGIVLHNLTIKGITFLGSKPSQQPLFYFRGVNAANIEFSNCSLIGQRGKIMNLYSTSNLFFHDNNVKDNYQWGIETDNMSANTYIVNNTFENNGANLSYNRCVTCSGKDFYIAHNTFKNFGYCAISLGVWYGSEMKTPSSGIVEYNNMYYDKDYFGDAWKYTIMDAGAIYLWTQNDGAIIRYNYIHDYTGAEQNRGIFCDDGASGFAIYGNVIVNTPNCHAIDSRRVKGTEKPSNSKSFANKNNVNNIVIYNVTDGTIHFVGNEQMPNGCKRGRNFKLRQDGKYEKTHKYLPELKNFELEVKDEEMLFLGHDKKGIIVPMESWCKIKKLPCFEGLKRFLRVAKASK